MPNALCYHCGERPPRYPEGTICSECFERIVAEETAKLQRERQAPELHCWAHHEDEQQETFTCLLWDGHAGEHEWTPDAAIEIEFAP
jgi:hypothetical protein